MTSHISRLGRSMQRREFLSSMAVGAGGLMAGQGHLRMLLHGNGVPSGGGGGTSALAVAAAALSAGQWSTFAVTDLFTFLQDSGSAGGTIVGDAWKFNWYSAGKIALFLGMGHHGGPAVYPQHFVRFSDSNATMDELPHQSFFDDGGTPRHAYGQSCIDESDGSFIVIETDATAHHYKIGTATWTDLADVPLDYPPAAVASTLLYFPEMGGIVHFAGNQLTPYGGLFFLPSPYIGQSWSRLDDGHTILSDTLNTGGAYSSVLQYCVFGSRGSSSVYKLSSSGIIAAMTDLPSDIKIGDRGGVATPDPVTGRILVVTGDYGAGTLQEWNTAGGGTFTQLADPPSGFYQTDDSNIFAGWNRIACVIPEYNINMFFGCGASVAQCWIRKGG
jgi:hypothetical protein